MLTAASRAGAATQPDVFSGEGSASLDRDAFLKLFITQIQQQDPLEPMEAQEYVAQLATFSSLEQLQKANVQLAVLNHMQVVVQAFLLIGRTIATSDGGVSGAVTGVTFEDGQPKLLVGEQVVEPGDVVSVS
jgi:flagellar basal-body rod modification protein FlgD